MKATLTVEVEIDEKTEREKIHENADRLVVTLLDVTVGDEEWRFTKNDITNVRITFPPFAVGDVIAPMTLSEDQEPYTGEVLWVSDTHILVQWFGTYGPGVVDVEDAEQWFEVKR